MKFLIDTNVFIQLEPTRSSEQEALTKVTVKLHRLAFEAGYQIFLHPVAKIDIGKDTDKARSGLRMLLFGKYPLLPDPPKVSPYLESQLGSASIGSNDWVDHHLVAALNSDAIDFVITEDQRLRRKFYRVGLGNRVLTVTEAVTTIRSFTEYPPIPPPAVRAVKAHAINPSDPIFNSFKKDYSGFENWFRKCRRQHRQAWVINDERQCIFGICIVKLEEKPPDPLSGKVLKLCSFKVSEEFNGFRFGELLLKTVFEHATKNAYDWLFITVFEKYSRLIELIEDFGFSKLKERTELDELILVKPLIYHGEEYENKPLQYHIKFGPHLFKMDVAWYVIPIKPKFANLLFPETASQGVLFQGAHAFGNSIRKAYLCNSPTISIPQGSVLLFYRSHRNKGVVAIGITEETFRSSESKKIAHLVGKRTVYSLKEINQLCQRPVLTVLFRQARAFIPPISTVYLIQNGIFNRPPQSIMQVKGEGLSWIQEQMLI